MDAPSEKTISRRNTTHDWSSDDHSANSLLHRSKGEIGWVPWTLKAPALLLLILLTFGFVGILEYLSYVSKRDGGLAFSTNGAFSAVATFFYLYFPTIIAVSFSFLWNWVDFDVKRLEPFFQLSKTGGASAKESLFLHYPFEFVALAPIRALRRKHWGVLCSGSIMLIIFWAVTPLQSAIFVPSNVLRKSTVQGHLTQGPDALQKFSSDLSVDFLRVAYEVQWLNESLPAYTTFNGSMIPFEADSSQDSVFEDANWTAETVFYTATLDCHEPDVSEDPKVPGRYHIDSGDGCNVPFDFPQSKYRYNAWYLGYYDNAELSSDLSNLGCPPSASNKFLAIWSDLNGFNVSAKPRQHVNFTSLFCEPKYWSQKIEATIYSSNGSVKTITPRGSSEELNTNKFNDTLFLYVVGAGILPDAASEGARGKDISDTELIRQPSSGIFKDLSPLNSPMVKFGLGATQLELSAYLDPKTLHLTFEKAQQLLFATAIRQAFSTPGSNGHKLAIAVSGSSFAVTVLRPLAIVVETLLLLVGILGVCLLALSLRRRSKLTENPSSISKVLALTTKNDGIPQTLRSPFGQSTSISLSDSAPVKLKVHRESNVGEERRLQSCNDANSQAARARPFYLAGPVGTIFAASLLAAMISLIVVFKITPHDVGLPLPSSNPIASQLILNYLPIAFATFLEPFWVLLDRMMCLLTPFEILRRDGSSIKKTLDLQYTSLPPQLTLWKSLRARHFLLSAICLASLFSNLLAVSLGGFFENKQVESYETHSFDFAKKTTFSTSARLPFNPDTQATTLEDHFYIAEANISRNNPLPPWTTQEFFFTPVLTDHLEASDTGLAATFGLHSSMNCSDVSSQTDMTMRSTPRGYELDLNINVTDTQGHPSSCNQSIPALTIGIGKNAFEQFSICDHNRTCDDELQCRPSMIVTYGRMTFPEEYIAANPNNLYLIDKRSKALLPPLKPSSMITLQCRPELYAGNFTVRFNTNGQIVSINQTSQLSSENSSLFGSQKVPYPIIRDLVQKIVVERQSGIHNDTNSHMWATTFVRGMSGMNGTIDPLATLPTAENLASAVEEIYTRLSAIIFNLFQDTYFPETNPQPVASQGSVARTEIRVFVSKTMFTISVAVLSFHIATAVCLYYCRPRKMMTGMPLSIASILQLFDGSSLYGRADEWDRHWQVAYGSYKGISGSIRIGIERSTFVTAPRC